MRMIGTLPGEREARRFEDYLLTLDIKSMVEAEDGEWIVWIFDEDRLDTARDELARFRDNSEAKQYRAVSNTAEQIRKEAEKQEAIARKQVVNVRDKWRQPGMQQSPLTIVLIILSIVVTFQTGFGKKDNQIRHALTFSDASKITSDFRPRGDEEIRKGQLWRLVTPIFIHLSGLHLIFNMIMMYQLGRLVESRRGSLRMGLMVLVIAVVSNYLQFKLKSPYFGGMSGVLYGLFGFAWMKTLHDPESGIRLHQQTIFILMAWFFLCWSGIGMFKNVANWAHTGGLIAGLILGYAPVVLRDLKRR
jgi:GlpG protein